MNAPNLPSILRREHLIPLTFLTLFSIVIIYGFTAGTMQPSAEASVSGAQKPPFMPSEDLAKEFNDDDLKVKDDKPRGKWTYSTLLDAKRNDPSVPAYVSGIQLLSGAGKHTGINKIKKVQVKNRSSQAITSIQVRFEVALLNEPDKILLEDTFPLVNVSIAPDAYEVVEIQTLYPPRMLKALAKNGELYGDFGIRMGVQEVRFADGSFWRRPEPGALLNSPYLNQFLGFRLPALASLGAHIPPPIRRPDIEQVNMTLCTLKPRSMTSAFMYVPFQTTTCYPDAGPSVDDEGRKSCGNVVLNTTCYATCGTTGHCETWQSEFPCDPGTTPTPTPTSSPTPTLPPCEPKPAPCCDGPIYENFLGSTILYCRWDCSPPFCGKGTVLANGCSTALGPQDCTGDLVFALDHGGVCCPPPPPPPPEDGIACYPPCTGMRFCVDGFCSHDTPVLVDVNGDGFALTDAAGGVDFALTAAGPRVRQSWTVAGSDDAWLALDRDGDGSIDGAHELFGNFTPQPPSPEKNGFLALAVFDRPQQGGNGDGRVDAGDAVFPYLRLWRDANHDGVSQPGELHALPSLDVARIHLDYRESKRTDAYGNQFRYRAKVDDAKGAKVNRWAWDVFLLRAP